LVNLTSEVVSNYVGGQVFKAVAPFLGGLLKRTGVKVAGRGGRALFNFSKKAAEHMENPSRAVPIQTLEQAIKGTKGILDPIYSAAILSLKIRQQFEYPALKANPNLTDIIFTFRISRKAKVSFLRVQCLM
jgi:hypothetical protein